MTKIFCLVHYSFHSNLQKSIIYTKFSDILVNVINCLFKYTKLGVNFMKRTIQKLLSVTFALFLTFSVFNIVPVSANTFDTASDISDYPVPSSIEIDGKEYYQLSDVDDLYWFADYVNSGNTEANAILTADIVINDGTFDKDGNFVPKIYGPNIRTWTPISNENTFNGTFDGQNHTISGIVSKLLHKLFICFAENINHWF